MHSDPSLKPFRCDDYSTAGTRAQDVVLAFKTDRNGLSRPGFVGRGPRHKHSMMKCIVAVSMHRHPVGGVTSQHATRSRDNMIDIIYDTIACAAHEIDRPIYAGRYSINRLKSTDACREGQHTFFWERSASERGSSRDLGF